MHVDMILPYMDLRWGFPSLLRFLQIGDLAAAIILKVLGDLDLKFSGIFFMTGARFKKKAWEKDYRAFFLGTSTKKISVESESHAFFGESVGLFISSCDFIIHLYIM